MYRYLICVTTHKYCTVFLMTFTLSTVLNEHMNSFGRLYIMFTNYVPSAPMDTSLTPLLAMKSSALLTLAILWNLILPRSGLGSVSPEMTWNTTSFEVLTSRKPHKGNTDTVLTSKLISQREYESRLQVVLIYNMTAVTTQGSALVYFQQSCLNNESTVVMMKMRHALVYF